MTEQAVTLRLRIWLVWRRLAFGQCLSSLNEILPGVGTCLRKIICFELPNTQALSCGIVRLPFFNSRADFGRSFVT